MRTQGRTSGARHEAHASPFALRSVVVLTLPLILSVGKDKHNSWNNNGVGLKIFSI